MTETLRSALIWSAAFLALELPAHFRLVPWFTLSNTVWHGETWWWPMAAATALFTLVLLGHLELHWSAKWLIAVAVGIAMLAISHALERIIA